MIEHEHDFAPDTDDRITCWCGEVLGDERTQVTKSVRTCYECGEQFFGHGSSPVSRSIPGDFSSPSNDEYGPNKRSE